MRQLLNLKVFLLLVLLLASEHSFSQNKLFTQYKFHRLNEKQGLTNYVINDILQDTLGFVWVATNEGLYRYQGNQFKRFVKDNEAENFIPNNFIVDLYLDTQNNVWIMTDDGIARYSYETDVIEPYQQDLLKGRISSMVIDQNGTQYFGKISGGISVVKSNLVADLKLQGSQTGIDFSVHSILKIAEQAGRLWAIVSDLGILCYDLKDEKVSFFSAEEITGNEKSKFFHLSVDMQSKVWIGTEFGVFALSLGEDGSKVVDDGLNNLLPQDDYLSVLQDDYGYIWIGSRQNGLYKMTASSKKEYRLISRFTPKDDESGVSHRTVSVIFQEKNGWFWLGTHNGGINVFNPTGERVRTITKQLNESFFSLNYQNVWGISQAKKGDIWVGTDGKGMSLLDPFTGQVTNSVFPELDEKAILCVEEDSKGRLWIGTYAHGLYMKEGNGDWVVFDRNSDNADLYVNDIRCIYEEEGQIFIGTNQGGLYTYDETNRRLKELVATAGLDIRTITSTGDGGLWLGTYGRGLFNYIIAQERLSLNNWNSHEEHASDVVFDIERDGQKIYVATRQNGLVVYDTKKGQFLHEPALDEIMHRSVSGVQMDGGHNLWITTNSGVFQYNIEAQLLTEYGSADGLQAGHFNFGSIFYSPNGFMAAGGIHGLNLFYPEELSRAAHRKGSIVFNQLKVLDKVITPMNSEYLAGGKSIFLTDEIELSYADNIFSINYSYPGYGNSKNEGLLYKLDGYDDHWQQSAISNEVTYRNVPPGNYGFKVKSERGGEVKELGIVIVPPIWKTWPAYVLYVVLLVFLIWRLVIFNNSRVVLQHKLEFEQELREKEQLVMQEKLRFYTNFSHELKTPLTLIQGPVTDLLKTTDNPLHKRYLSLIKKNTGIILRFINRMLEFRKIEMNKTTLNVGKHDVKILAQEEAESFAYLAKDKGIKFGFYCENDLQAWLDLEKLQIIMNNLLSNAFKFTGEGKSVNFGVLSNESEIIVEVKDEGVGIKASEIDQIFSPFYQASNSYSAGGTGIGLALSKSFVELHQGWIDVESKEGEGTKIMVHIPKAKERFEGQENVKFVQVVENDSELLAVGVDDKEDLARLEATENEKMILVVDDNRDISAYIESLFESEYRVVKAENGAEAYEIAISNTPDVIISDVMMPGMNGMEFCQKIKGNIATSHVPVIMLTAKDSKQDMVKGYDVGADGYITKPFSSDVLKARVNNLLKNREMLELKYESNDLIDTKSAGQTKEVEFVLQAEKMILQMLEESEFSVPLLCKELGMSQSALYRKIKSLTGVSIQVFIRKIRIKRAAQLLLAEDMTVTEIAFALEFSDLSYFRKCFKEQYGKTPSEYKAEQTSKNETTKIEVDSL